MMRSESVPSSKYSTGETLQRTAVFELKIVDDGGEPDEYCLYSAVMFAVGSPQLNAKEFNAQILMPFD